MFSTISVYRCIITTKLWVRREGLCNAARNDPLDRLPRICQIADGDTTPAHQLAGYVRCSLYVRRQRR